MKWNDLLKIVGREPVFRSSLLKAGKYDNIDLGKQLSRWVKSGKLIQIRRGIYALSERYQKTSPHNFYVANRIKKGSYVSLQSALEYYGHIPEYVPNITNVTTGRPETISSPLGTFIYKHIKKSLFFGYRVIDLGDNQSASVAVPEKALLDLLYLTPSSDKMDYIQELRLQNVNKFDVNLMKDFVKKIESHKLERASQIIESLIIETQEL